MPALSWSNAALWIVLVALFASMLFTDELSGPWASWPSTIHGILAFPTVLPFMLFLFYPMAFLINTFGPDTATAFTNSFGVGFLWLPAAINQLVIFWIVVAVSFRVCSPARQVLTLNPGSATNSYGPEIVVFPQQQPEEVARAARHATVWGRLAIVCAVIGVIVTALSAPLIASIPLLVAAPQFAALAMFLSRERRRISVLAIWLTIISVLIFVIVLVARWPSGETPFGGIEFT
ncbi:hypothetical protein J4H92_04235 [Leucobacter weissii]|uniref:Uncharacterized protein n=1 Tax=Leucobacter weissii TaxID=1983706 RepID=A0A939MIE2_9MICO|nr:hypothetical protein [Leucobacter weissii]MBO1901156.1 hypothetical protein [Leucobacter weissii]